MVASMGTGLIGKACRKGDAQSCEEADTYAVGLSASILGCDAVKCGLLQPILDIHSNKVPPPSPSLPGYLCFSAPQRLRVKVFRMQEIYGGTVFLCGPGQLILGIHSKKVSAPPFPPLDLPLLSIYPSFIVISAYLPLNS